MPLVPRLTKYGTRPQKVPSIAEYMIRSHGLKGLPEVERTLDLERAATEAHVPAVDRRLPLTRGRLDASTFNRAPTAKAYGLWAWKTARLGQRSKKA